MAKDIPSAVREVCLSFPEVTEHVAHGFPDFRVRGKVFASFIVNHHGDGRVALWLPAPDGAQELHVGHAPQHYFVPPYVGPRGWLGVHLDKGLSWKTIAQRVREAYEKIAPRALAATLGKTVEIKPPVARMKPEEMDPLLAPAAQRLLALLRELCLALPQTDEAQSFGNPVWRVGKKTFAWLQAKHDRRALIFWVGVEHQGLYTADPRYSIPMYLGNAGWIALDVTRGLDTDEVRALALQSYRHYAKKKALEQLDAMEASPGAAKKPPAKKAAKKPAAKKVAAKKPAAKKSAAKKSAPASRRRA